MEADNKLKEVSQSENEEEETESAVNSLSESFGEA
jgi:hypothetical protein